MITFTKICLIWLIRHSEFSIHLYCNNNTVHIQYYNNSAVYTKCIHGKLQYIYKDSLANNKPQCLEGHMEIHASVTAQLIKNIMDSVHTPYIKNIGEELNLVN